MGLAMKIVIAAMITWFAVASGDKVEGDSTCRNDLCQMTLPDGSSLKIGIESYPGDRQKEMGVDVALYSKEGAIVWRAWDITTVKYTPGAHAYYALGKVLEDRILVFTMWNGAYCVIDKKFGRVLRRGQGDDVLKEYESFVPLRLTFGIGLRQSFGRYRIPTPSEMAEAEKQSMRERRECSTVLRSQPISGSKLEKAYVIHFETDQDVSAKRRRRPLFVIVWKAEKIGAVGFGFQRAISEIAIHGHLVTPRSTKDAIYALQPDYSLQQLHLTEEEITRLFSRITARELQIDERVASLIERQGTDWLNEGYDEQGEEGLFPAAPDWEQKVDPHLKVVEPPGELGVRPTLDIRH